MTILEGGGINFPKTIFGEISTQSPKYNYREGNFLHNPKKSNIESKKAKTTPQLSIEFDSWDFECFIEQSVYNKLNPFWSFSTFSLL